VTEVVTGEAVVLEVPCARFPSRLLALVIDLIVQIVLFTVLLSILGVAAVSSSLNPASAGAIAVTVIVAVVVGYPVIWETLTRGRSPGKFALGLRVVGDDGSPERFRQALVRGLSAAVEIWMFAGCPALICSLLSTRGKRLGDLFAGTFVIQQRLPARRAVAGPVAIAPELARWAAGLELSGLTEQTAATARRYLARLRELTPSAQAELGERIAATVRAQVSPPPPPGVPAPVYLGTVLAERHNREHARLTGAGALATPYAAPGYGTPPAAVMPTPTVPVGAVGASTVPTHAAPTQPGAVPPGIVPPAAARTAPEQPATAPPGAAQPATAPPGTAPPGTVRPEATQPETGWSGGARQGEEPGGEPPARRAGGFVPPE
jgi:uncharacterized RDD family membrane protein YckC